MHSTTIAVDVAKSVFEIAVSQRPGRVSARRRLSRGQFSRFLAEQAPATVVMEACGMAHFWGREAGARGHRVVLLPPHAVRPYVLRNKTDGADAKGLLEAVRNESIRPVPVKSVDQQLLTGLHRMRSAWMGTRTARLNTVRGLLRELGLTIPVGARQVVPHVGALVSDADSGLPDALRPVLAEAAREIRELEARVHAVDRALEGLASASALLVRLRTIPGVGVLTATALVAFVGDAHRFPSGRHLASYLGLTPRESSSGLRRRLGAISKRGDPYLRMLLIHGARSVLCHAKKATGEPDRLRRWALDRERSRGHNKATVALANKLARVAWAVWRRERAFGVPAQPREEWPTPARLLRAPDGDGAPVLTGAGEGRQQGWPAEAAVSDWLPARGFPSWPGARALHETEAGDTTAVGTPGVQPVVREIQLAGGVQIRLVGRPASRRSAALGRSRYGMAVTRWHSWA